MKGDVVGIERAPGRTEVLVDEGLTQAAYALDEALIDLGAALEFLVRGGRGGTRDWSGAVEARKGVLPMRVC